MDGELPNTKLPLVPGHEIVGYVEEMGDSVSEVKVGDRVGIPWLAGTCGVVRTAGRGGKTFVMPLASQAIRLMEGMRRT